ncbi:MAG: PilZ domain-containing protein [Sedimentisphaerales bacterium]|nr:PilZ domain-containing protein [Sedimentisphaerales bacterium]
MGQKTDRRAHRRLDLRLAVLCRRVGAVVERPYTGNTLNISPDGALLQISGRKFYEGELLHIDIAIPPAKELLKNGGRFSTQAQVVRIDTIESPRHPRGSVGTEQIAVQFCHPPHLQM